MITVLSGDNSFEIDRALQRLTAGFEGAIERVDGAALELAQLPDLVMGGTLFSTTRLVVVRGLADSKTVWAALPDWLPRVSEDVRVVLVEGKLDKRTKTYKELKAAADLQEFTSWTERDTGSAVQWVVREATGLGMALDKKSAQLLVERVGLDQWQLYQALQQLSVLDAVDEMAIARLIEASPAENVFNLFEAALRGDTRRVGDMLRTLELTEDPFMLFGLLSGQAFQLFALAASSKPAAEVAKDIGAHPFALSKLAPYANRLGSGGAHQVVRVFAEADEAMKLGGEPWLLVERALIKTAAIARG